MKDKKLKFFVDCHVFDKGFEGTRTYIQGLYLELINDKNKMFYFAGLNINVLEKIFGKKENVYYLKYTSKNPFYRLLIEIPFMIKQNKIDFAHFQYRTPPIKKCKYIVTTHDVLFEDFPNDFPKIDRIQSYYTYKYSAKIADLVFTVSEYSKNKIQKHLKIKNVVVMHNGVDEVFFEDYNKIDIQKELKERYNISNYILSVSRFEPRKNQHLLLKYFILEKLYKTYDLIFIGNKTFENKEFDEIYNNLNEEIKSKIKIFQGIEFSAFIKIIKGARLAVYPSRAEGFGIPPLESIAAGVTTICSNTTAMSDFVFFNEYAFNPNDENDFIRALRFALISEDKNIKEKVKFVKEKYNWKNAAKLFEKEINNLIY